MLKEIHEQADALAEAIADRTALGDCVRLAEEGVFDEELLHDVDRIVVVACGTAYHAGLIGRYAIEEWARLPVEVEVASEYRYRNPVVGERDLVLGITQSGETADTLAAMRLAAQRGARVWQSRTRWARRQPASPSASSIRAPDSRSASRRRRHSSARLR